jgi:virginiamycin A acetyltransferase
MRDVDSMTTIEPRIVESSVAKGCHIGQLSEVLQSQLLESASVYRMARIKASVLGKHCSVGDGACVDFSEVGDRVRIGRYNHLLHVEIGTRSFTGPHTVLIKSRIGKYCSLSWGVTVGGGEHDYTRLSTHSFLYSDYDGLRPAAEPPTYDRFAAPCTVGSDVWIAASATILRGVKVGDGAVVAANAVVTRDVPPYALVAGVPARVMKLRFQENVIERLLEIRWWDFPDALIRDNFEFFVRTPDDATLRRLESLRAELGRDRPSDE